MTGMRTFGVEEEYLLLDADTGMPRDAADDMVTSLSGRRAEHEFLLSQLETATEPCESSRAALDELTEFRLAATAAAADHGLVLAGSGLPPVGGDTVSGVSENPRYSRIRDHVRGAVKRYYATGAHVHVGVASRDEGRIALAHFARFSPSLLALAVNSPVYLGEDTGFASWRHQFTQQWATSGYPPHFESVSEYEHLVDSLVRVGALVDPALVNWSIRLSEKYPTVELRTADAQLTVEDTVAFGALFRALVSRGQREHELGAAFPGAQPDCMRSAHWLAARDGVTGELFDPFEVELRPAFDLIDDMLGYASDELEEAGDTELVEGFIERRRADRGAATLQLDAWRDGGVPALLDLYRQGSARTA